MAKPSSRIPAAESIVAAIAKVGLLGRRICPSAATNGIETTAQTRRMTASRATRLWWPAKYASCPAALCGVGLSVAARRRTDAAPETSEKRPKAGARSSSNIGGGGLSLTGWLGLEFRIAGPGHAADERAGAGGSSAICRFSYTHHAAPVKVAGPGWPARTWRTPGTGSIRLPGHASALDAGSLPRRRFPRAGVLPPRREGDSQRP